MESTLLNIQNKTIECTGCMLQQINIAITVEREKVIENQNRNKTRIGSNEKNRNLDNKEYNH